jgi:hypothetical protein
MVNKNYNTERIEDSLWDLCRNIAGVSDKVFVGKRPDSTESQMETFAVVSMLTALRDLEAYGRGVVRVALYAKDLQGGIKNSPALKKMGDALMEHLPYQTEDYLFDFSSESSFPDKSGYNIKAINAYVVTLTRK